MILPVPIETHPVVLVNSVKLAGARRGILKLPGVEEDVGLIGIHWKGEFIELVPWNASVNWDVDPWGSWKVAHLHFVVQSLLCITWHASVLHGCLRLACVSNVLTLGCTFGLLTLCCTYWVCTSTVLEGAGWEIQACCNKESHKLSPLDMQQ